MTSAGSFLTFFTHVATGNGITMRTELTVFALCLVSVFGSFVPLRSINSHNGRQETTGLSMSEVEKATDLSKVASKFKVMTCSASSCAQKRKVMRLDDFATYGGFYNRIKEGPFDTVQLEETSCLGSCKLAPAVAIQHEDFVGNVALEGMTDNEFSKCV